MLNGKTGVIFGVANKRSIAYAIAKAAHAEGAGLALNYQAADMGDKVGDLVAELGRPFTMPCDVTKDGEVAAFFEAAGKALGRIDFLVHSIASAKREELSGLYLDTSREGFSMALDVSAYSLVSLARAAAPWMSRGGSVIALTYLGSERAVPSYNVMGVAKAALESSVRYLAADLGPKGVRVNAISAGPINTVSARGVAGFADILDHVAKTAPLRRNVTAEDVADTAVFLLSDKSRGITGEVIFVDGGYSIMGMQPRG